MGVVTFNSISGKPELALDSISPVEDSNEITNHWLRVISAKCVRKHDALSAGELAEKPAGSVDSASKVYGEAEREEEKQHLVLSPLSEHERLVPSVAPSRERSWRRCGAGRGGTRNE